jgi:CBS domain containing-hemolysin-like protein
MDVLGLLLSQAVLLGLSGLISAAETALFSIAPLRLKELSRSAVPGEQAVARIMTRPREALVTILVVNTVVNILAAALGAEAAIGVLDSTEAGVLVATAIMTLLILVVGEIAPKTVAYHHAEPIARAAAGPLATLGRLLTPVSWPLLRFTDLALGRERRPDERVDLAEVEAMLRLAHAEGEVETHERDLVRGVIELGNSPLKDVMTPRTEILSLPADTDVATARERVQGAGFSKVPVSTGGPDEMSGFVTALDLLLGPADAPVAALVRPISYVPEVKPALELLDEFRRTGERIALVVDEHGHLVGLVTLTDLLEEISGEIIEGSDLHKVQYRLLGPRRVAIPGRMEIRFFNEEFGTELEAEDAETVAGLVLERAGRIPGPGERFRFDSVELEILEVEPNKILSIAVTLPEAGRPEGEAR